MLVDRSTTPSRVDWTERPARLENPITVADGADRDRLDHVAPRQARAADTRTSSDSSTSPRTRDIAARSTCTEATMRRVSIPDVRTMLAVERPPTPTSTRRSSYYDRERACRPTTQAIFATGWETAYPAYLDRVRGPAVLLRAGLRTELLPARQRGDARREHVPLRVPRHHGGWLARPRSCATEYGMSTDHFDFAVDKSALQRHEHGAPQRGLLLRAPGDAAPRLRVRRSSRSRDFARLKPDVDHQPRRLGRLELGRSRSHTATSPASTSPSSTRSTTAAPPDS